VSLIRFYISVISRKFTCATTAVFLLLIGGTRAFTAEPKASPVPEIHRITDILQPLLRPAELLLEPTHLVLLMCFGIFAVVVAVLVYVLIRFRPRGPEDHLEEPPQVYGSYNIKMAWTVIPCLILFILVSARSIVENQKQLQASPKDAIAIQGRKDFYDLSSVFYHKIDTTPAEGVFGPYLTKFAAYQKLSASELPQIRRKISTLGLLNPTPSSPVATCLSFVVKNSQQSFFLPKKSLKNIRFTLNP
jgi:hypothetical protein